MVRIGWRPTKFKIIPFFFFLKNNWFYTFKFFRCVMNYISFMTIVTQFMFSTTLKVFFVLPEHNVKNRLFSLVCGNGI